MNKPPARSPGSRRQAWLGAVAASLAGILFLAWAACPRGPRLLERWPAADSGFTPWQPLAPGVDYARANFAVPRPLKCHALRIDLQEPDLEFVVNPGTEPADGTVAAHWPSSFLRRFDLIAAINATPFTPEATLPGTTVRLQGLAIAEGRPWAAKVSNLDALVVTRDHMVRFLRNDSPVTNAWAGVGGFLMTLREGRNVGEISPQDAATTVGVSADGRWMFWLVVDGGQPGYSEGATPQETAALLLQLGAAEAINLDGGSSSTLVTADGWTGARVRNRPRSPLVSGLQRPVGAVLGIRSKSRRSK